MEAIVLRRRDIKEYDQVIHVLTREQGKLTLYARGTKKLKSKNASQLEPGSFVEFGMVEGKEFPYVTSVQGKYYFTAVRQDMTKALGLQYVLDVLDRCFLEGEHDEILFEQLLAFLYMLEAEDDPRQSAIIDDFLLQVLDRLGLMPVFDRCVVCEKDMYAEEYGELIYEEGGIVCPSCVRTHIEKKQDKMSRTWKISTQLIPYMTPFHASEREKSLLDARHAGIINFFPYFTEKKLDSWQKIFERLRV